MHSTKLFYRLVLSVALLTASVWSAQAQPAAPANFTALSGSASAGLQWSVSTGATSYNVQRSSSDGGPYSLVSNVAGTTYTDSQLSNGIAYYYLVSAVSNGVAGANSPQATAIPILNNGVYELINQLSGLALDNFNNANGPLDQQPLAGSAQLWTLNYVGGMVFHITAGTGLVVSGATPSAQLTLDTPQGALQLWTFQVVNGSNYLVSNVGSGQLMNDFNNSTNAGTAIGQWPFTPGGANQNWSVVQAQPQLLSVAVTNGGVMPQYTFTGQVNTHGLPATVICAIGTNTSYNGASVTNAIAGSNQPVNFSVTVPFTTDRTTPLHAMLTVSNSAGGATSGDLPVNAISFELRLSGRFGVGITAPGAIPDVGSDNIAWLDANGDGHLDLAYQGVVTSLLQSQYILINPGSSSTNIWKSYGQSYGLASGGREGFILVGDLDNDNIPDSVWSGDTFVNGQGHWGSAIMVYSLFSSGQLVNFAFPTFYNSTIERPRGVLADFDHDGKQDMLLAAFHPDGGDTAVGSLVHQIYRNISTNGLQGAGALAAFDSPVALGGMANHLNFFLVGGWTLAGGFLTTNGFMDAYAYDYTIPQATIYRNDGELGFTVVTNLPGIGTGGDPTSSGDSAGYHGGASCVWADFNGDGFDDLLVCENSYLTARVRILLNDGHGNFTNSGWVLPQYFKANAAVGDIFNHGRNDLVMSGYGGEHNNSAVYTTVLRNDGNGVFTPVDFGLFPEVDAGNQAIALADYDNDGRLDIAVIGSDGSAGFVPNQDSLSLYRNELNIASNEPPTAPAGLGSTVSAGRVDLHWGGATDDITPTNGLTYNLRIGSTPLGTDICSPLANVTNGWRRIVARGNVGHCFGTYYHLPPGTYYWSVQAIDGAYAGGAWASEQTFTIMQADKPTLTINNTNVNDVIWSSRFNGYQVEQTTDVAHGPWTTNASAVLGTSNGKWSVTVSNRAATTMFYRLRQ